MYGIFTYIQSVDLYGKCSIHGSYGIYWCMTQFISKRNSFTDKQPRPWAFLRQYLQLGWKLSKGWNRGSNQHGWNMDNEWRCMQHQMGWHDRFGNPFKKPPGSLHFKAVVSKMFGMFIPKSGEMIQFDEHIFQMGWNHQLDEFSTWKKHAIPKENIKKSSNVWFTGSSWVVVGRVLFFVIFFGSLLRVVVVSLSNSGVVEVCNANLWA